MWNYCMLFTTFLRPRAQQSRTRADVQPWSRCCGPGSARSCNTCAFVEYLTCIHELSGTAYRVRSNCSTCTPRLMIWCAVALVHVCTSKAPAAAVFDICLWSSSPVLQGGAELDDLLQKVSSRTTLQERNLTMSEHDHLVDAILNQLEDPDTVLWAPEYGSAALLHDTPRPNALSEIHVLGLDGWEDYQHRCAAHLLYSR